MIECLQESGGLKERVFKNALCVGEVRKPQIINELNKLGIRLKKLHV